MAKKALVLKRRQEASITTLYTELKDISLTTFLTTSIHPTVISQNRLKHQNLFPKSFSI